MIGTTTAASFLCLTFIRKAHSADHQPDTRAGTDASATPAFTDGTVPTPEEQPKTVTFRPNTP